jgi:uncharacterized membrane-anchored protein
MRYISCNKERRLTGLNNITIWIVALLFLSKSTLWLLGNAVIFYHLPVDPRDYDLSDLIGAMDIFCGRC